MLKSDPLETKSDRNFDYWMEIKRQTQEMGGLSGYIPYETYIWAGDDGPDEGDEPDWCFVYGENEWMHPIHHPLTDNALTWSGYRDLAEAKADRRAACE